MRDDFEPDASWDGILALSDDATIVHEFPGVEGPIERPEHRKAMEILFLGVSPKDEVMANVDQEWKCLTDSVQRAAYTGIRVPLRPDRPYRITREALARLHREGSLASMPGGPPLEYTVIHVAGHGEVDPLTGEFDFVVESKDGNGERLSGALFAQAVCHGHDIALAVLNSCWGIGVAQAFLKAGVSQVVGNRGATTDRAAVEFSHSFYDCLFQGATLPEALRDARRRIREVAGQAGTGTRSARQAAPWDWANPVWIRGAGAWLPDLIREDRSSHVVVPAPGTWAGRSWKVRFLLPVLSVLVALSGGALFWSRWDGASLPGQASGDVLVLPDAWPTNPRVLVLPFEGVPVRKVDQVLWPLMDRFLVNALEPEDRFGASIQRVDPRDVSHVVSRRGLEPPFGEADVRMLAREFGATVVFHGGVSLDGGTMVAGGVLRLVDETQSGASPRSGKRMESRGLRATDVAADLARSIIGTLGLTDVRSGEIPTERRKALLLGEGPVRIMDVVQPADLPRDQRVARYQSFLEEHPDAPGPAWLLHLEESTQDKADIRLAGVADRVTDPELASFFRTVSTPGASCEGFDPEMLGRGHPWLLGPLAQAVCLYREGRSRYGKAMDLAIEAFHDMRLRRLAAPFLVRLLPADCGRSAELREEMLRWLPEDPIGWSALATWLVNCGERERPGELLAAAQALLGRDWYPEYRVTYHALTIAMTLLEPLESRRFADELRRLHEDMRPGTVRPDARFHLSYGMYLGLEGRFQSALKAQEDGLKAAVGCGQAGCPDRDGGIQILASLVYGYLQQALAVPNEGSAWLSKAEALLADFGRLTRDDDRRAKRYILDMLGHAVASTRCNGRRCGQIWTDAQAIEDNHRDGLVQEGKTSEIPIQRGYLAAHLRDVDECLKLVREHPGLKYLAGCQSVIGRHLLEEGRPGESVERLAAALRDLFIPAFVFADELPRVLHSLAEAEGALGHRAEACRLHRVVASLYRKADREVPEYQKAHRALATLECPGEASP
jgi:hypothetical protein